jgi:hypothetical protein
VTPIKIICAEELIAKFNLEQIGVAPNRGDTIQLLMNRQHIFSEWTAWKIDNVRYFIDVDYGSIIQIWLYVSPSANTNSKI